MSAPKDSSNTEPNLSMEKFLNRKIHRESPPCIWGEDLFMVGSKFKRCTATIYTLNNFIDTNVISVLSESILSTFMCIERYCVMWQYGSLLFSTFPYKFD